jgi:hypothetical protein
MRSRERLGVGADDVDALRDATVTPRPSLSESEMSARCPSAAETKVEVSDAGYAARTG